MNIDPKKIGDPAGAPKNEDGTITVRVPAGFDEKCAIIRTTPPFDDSVPDANSFLPRPGSETAPGKAADKRPADPPPVETPGGGR